MNDATTKARQFLTEETAFRLGILPTEASHPKTASLSETIVRSTSDGVRMLMQVDHDIPPAMTHVVATEAYARLVESLVEAVSTGKRVFFTGCGATGRLAILLEAAWRAFWQELFVQAPELRADLPNLEDCVVSVMAGGDYALIRSVEGFEDSTDLGRYQLQQAGVTAGDVVVAVTEGGETSFVIGTAWKGLEAGARVFFVYNNPTDVLRQHVARSREVIEEPRITKLDLFTGPMAVAGSTRMQATTAELLIVGSALETALFELLSRWLSADLLCRLGLTARRPADYPRLFAALVEQLGMPGNVEAIAGMVEWEEAIYRDKGLVTYATDRFLLDVLTDTTERSPTFRLPPFRKSDDAVSAPSWAFVKNLRHNTCDTWWHVLRREPRGIAWPDLVYRRLDVSEELRESPPRLDNSEIHKFMIGREPDASRSDAPGAGVAMILIGDEIQQCGPAREAFDEAFAGLASSYTKTVAIGVGPSRLDRGVQHQFHVACDLPSSPLRLWDRLAVKLTLNLMSTGTMARMGRVDGNYMSRVETSNKKLIDRGIRLVSYLASVDYDTACYALYEAMDAVSQQTRITKDAPSPVALAVENVRKGQLPDIEPNHGGNGERHRVP